MYSKVSLSEGMAFDVDVEGESMVIDASAEHGGDGRGPQPKALVLTALAGCTAMDVISILRKMRLSVDRFEVEADGTVVEEHPRVFSAIALTYHVDGDVPEAKVRRAVHLSEDRYCPVSAMLQGSVAISHTIVLNGTRLP